MDALTALAASGLRARTESLDVLANNIANSSTAGYKADGEAYNLYFGEQAWEGIGEGRPAMDEMPLVQKSWTNFNQGTMLDTGNPEDVALRGAGFFAVQKNGNTLYTRSGHFRVNKQGALETQEGYAVLDAQGKPIQLDPAQSFAISRDGQITQSGAPVATLQVVSPDSPNRLTKQGGAYFTLDPKATVAPAAGTEVFQGKVESSNVEPTQASVQLVGVLRQFEVMQRAVRMAGDMGKQAVEQVAKISS